MAWIDPEIVFDVDPNKLRRAVKTGEGVISIALPFSQGLWVGDGDNPKPGVVLSLFDDPSSNPNLGVPEFYQLLDWLKRYRLVFHNAKFDLHHLRYAPIGWGGLGFDFLDWVYWDTQVVCQVIWPFQLVSSLKPTAARLWGVDVTAEAEALKPYLGPANNPRYDLVPWSVIGPYAARDADLTIRLFYHQMALLGRWGVWGARDRKTYHQCVREIDTMKVLYRMERAGVPYDADASTEAGKKLAAVVAEIDQKLPFKPTSHGAKGWFFSRGVLGREPGLNLKPYELTKTGDVSMTAQVVDLLVRDNPPETRAGEVARLWKTRAKLNHAANAWYLPWGQMIGADGRLRTCFRQASRGRGDEEGGTASGRFSVERVNLQAIPHDYKLVSDGGGWPVHSPRALIGRAAAKLDGWDAWEFDLAQAELRLAAAWANCEPMLDAIRHGRDLHGETTEALFHKTKDHPDWGFYRQVGKRGNFTLCFGAGGETFAKMVARETGRYIGLGEAKNIVESWNALYPQFREANEWWGEYARQKGYVPLASEDGFATGRLRVFRPEEETYKAFNQIVQASLAEYMKAWLVGVQREMDQLGYGFVPGVGWTGLVLTIHDSLVGLFPADGRGEEAASVVTRVASETWTRFFGQSDPLGRVSAVPGFAEAKKWTSAGG